MANRMLTRFVNYFNGPHSPDYKKYQKKPVKREDYEVVEFQRTVTEMEVGAVERSAFVGWDN